MDDDNICQICWFKPNHTKTHEICGCKYKICRSCDKIYKKCIYGCKIKTTPPHVIYYSHSRNTSFQPHIDIDDKIVMIMIGLFLLLLVGVAFSSRL